MASKSITRRTFLMGTAAAVAASTFRGPKTVSANSKLNIVSIGAGGRARADIHGMSSENIVALCDVDWDTAAQTFSEFPEARQYKDYREMLDTEKDIDAVIVATPDHFHAVAAMHAMALGKHVYVEKPLTYSIGEARALTEAARKHNVMTQMGNQGHSRDGVRKLCEMVDHGDLGDVTEVHLWTNRPVWPQGVDRPKEAMPVPDTMDWDIWLGPAPERPYHKKYAPFMWRGWWDFGCGALGDMACHIADPANWALRLSEVGPTRVEVIQQEGNNDETFPTQSKIKYEFPARGNLKPVTVYWYDGGLMPERPKGVGKDVKLGEGDNGTLFIGTKGVATCNTYSDNPRVIAGKKHAKYQFPEETIPRIERQNHHVNWLEACKGGNPACSNFDYAGPFTEWILLGNLALKHPGKTLEWDAKNMRVTNEPAANDHIMRDYRKGWTLDV